MNKTTCTLDPFPTSILVASDLWINMFVLLIVCITTGQFHNTLKSAVVKPLLKKPTLNPHILKNYRPVYNLPFLSKVTEKVIAKQLTAHMLKHDIFEEFQSDYKANHRTETTVLKVFIDIMLNLDILKLNDPQFTIDNTNKCISDLHTWMITNRLKIN